jgi:cytidine deaminase
VSERKIEIRALIRAAVAAREQAYAPYSRFQVGAALLTQQGEIYTGCNVECAAYSVTQCAERTAIGCAVSNGCTRFAAIAIVGGEGDRTPVKKLCPPCGVCRQMLAEFCDMNNFKIILAKSEEEYSMYYLKQLLPLGFGPGNLEG